MKISTKKKTLLRHRAYKPIIDQSCDLMQDIYLYLNKTIYNARFQ